jgi:hypothetical protein
VARPFDSFLRMKAHDGMIPLRQVRPEALDGIWGAPFLSAPADKNGVLDWSVPDQRMNTPSFWKLESLLRMSHRC